MPTASWKAAVPVCWYVAYTRDQKVFTVHLWPPCSADMPATASDSASLPQRLQQRQGLKCLRCNVQTTNIGR